MHIIQDFSLWKRVNEADLPPRLRARSAEGVKLVLIPVDSTTLKIKMINEQDVIDDKGRLTQNGFLGILGYIAGQPQIVEAYPKLKKMYSFKPDGTIQLVPGPNMIIYSIASDSSRKQVILFEIYSKVEVNQMDPSMPLIPDNILFVRKEDIQKGSIVQPGTRIMSAGTSGAGSPQASSNQVAPIKVPIKASAIDGSQDPSIIAFIKNAWKAVYSKVGQTQIMAKVKTEVSSGTLGINSKIFVKSLNAGFKIIDVDWGQGTEEGITQQLVDNLKTPDTLDVSAFTQESDSSVSQTSTGDIKVPAGGFKQGIKNDPEFKKVQDLLKSKLVSLAGVPAYDAFAKAGRKGFYGNYGQLTADLVKLLKTNSKDASGNPYPNQDGATVEADFVKTLQSMNESSTYLGLDGMTIVTEQFTVDLTKIKQSAPKPAPAPKPAARSSQSAPKPAQVDPMPAGLNVKAFQEWLANGEPSVVNGRKWTYSAEDQDGKWGASVAAAWKSWSDMYLTNYDLNGTKKQSSSNQSSSQSSPTIDAAYKKKIDGAIISLMNDVKQYIEAPGTFEDFKGAGNDDEEGAWKFLMNEYYTTWSTKVKNIKKLVAAIPDSDRDKKRYNSTIKKLVNNVFKTKPDTGFNSQLSEYLWHTFVDGGATDTFSITLNLSGTKTQSWEIECDF